MQKFVLVMICILALGSGSAYAERSTVMFRAQKVDKTPSIPDKGKAPRRMPFLYQDGYTLIFSPIIQSTLFILCRMTKSCILLWFPMELQSMNSPTIWRENA